MICTGPSDRNGIEFKNAPFKRARYRSVFACANRPAELWHLGDTAGLENIGKSLQ